MPLRRSPVVALSTTFGVVGTLVVPLLGTAALGAAERSWGPVVDLSRPAPYIYGPQVAVDPVGSSVAVWVRDSGERSSVHLAARAPGSAWASSARVPGTQGAREAVLAFAGDGTRTLVWVSGREVKASRMAPGGAWSVPALLHRTATGSARGAVPGDLQLAVGRRGRAVVAWNTIDDDMDAVLTKSRVQAVVGDAAGRWSRVRNLSGRHEGFGPEVAIDATGRTMLVWTAASASRRRVMVASRPVGEGWSDALALSRWSHGVNAAQLAAQQEGHMVAAWSYAGPTSSGIRVARWSSGSGWAAPERVSSGSFAPGWMDLGIDGAGAVTVAWSNRANAVWTAEQPRAGRWTRARVAPAGSVFYGLRLVVNPAGDAVLGWQSVDGGHHPVLAAYRPRSSGWGPATMLSAARGDAWGAVALGRDGDAVAAWASTGDIEDLSARVQARVFSGN